MFPLAKQVWKEIMKSENPVLTLPFNMTDYFNAIISKGTFFC